MNHPFFPAQPAAGARRPLRPASQLLPLEQRFMFDAAVADAAHAAQAHDSAPPLPPAVTVRAAEPARDEGRKEVVLVDTSLANYKSLEAGVRDGVGIVEFDGSRDGLAQIAQWAASQSGLDAIHILSHGSQGMVNLGSTALTEASLASATTQAELAQLGQALTSDGDLLLYGCDVAAGGGTTLLAGLAKATGADLAASTDTTGAARLGGDWTLEARDGKIDTRELALAQYDGALTVVPFIYASDGDDFTPVTTITKTVSGQPIKFTGPEMYIYNNSLPDDGLYPYASDGTSGVNLTVKNESGYSFDISSFGVQSYAGSLHFDVTFADGTTASFNQGGINSSGVISTVSSFSTALNDVTSVTITSSDYTTFQNFNITDVKLLPPAARVNSASLGTDTGSSGSDFITNTAAQLISGTLSANLASGEKVQVSYDNGGSWSDATTYAVGASSWSTTTTLAGSNTFIARVTNADSVSTAYSHTYTLDTTAPTTSFSGYTLSADTGTAADLITNTASQTIGATLSGAPAGTDVVWGSTDNGNSWTNITSKVSGTTLTWNGATLDATNQTLRFKVTDLAGNDSGLSIQAYTLDTTAPTTSVASAAFSNDSGTLSTDFITNAASQTISGTLSANLAAGETVQVSLDNGGTWATATAVAGTSTWSLGGRTLTASSTLKVKLSDTAGNDSTVLSQVYVYDTSAPTTTFSGLALSADTGTAGDFITKTAAQTVSATLSGALSGTDILYGSLDNGASWTDITSKVSTTTLAWNGVTLSGSDTLQLKVADAAGNESAVRSQAYVLDTTVPATPGTPVLATASDTGHNNADGITSDNTPTFTGTGETGSTVSIYDGVTLLGTATVAAGNWSFTSGALGNGSHAITAVASDTAGNLSAASAALSITVDTTAPTVASVAVPANGTYYSGGALDFTVNFDEAVTVDTAGGTPRIAMVVGATTRYASYVSGSGSSALVFRYTVPNGDVDANGVTVGALSLNGGSLKDDAGNNAVTTLNSVGSTAGINVDGTNPSITNVSASTADGTYGSGQTITITVDFSGAVDVDTTGGTPTLALDGGGSATYTGGSGSSTLTFSYTVGAGQNSADLDYSSTGALALNGATIIDAGGAHQAAAVTLATPGTAGSLGANKDLVIDTAAPTNTVAGAAFSADTGTSGSDFITKTAAQTVSGTLASNLAAGENVYVSLDNGATWDLATATTGANTWSLAGQTLTGSGTLKVRVSDDAGNNGTAYAQAYVLDTTAPSISFSGVALSADTGVAGDLITNTAAQTISATLSGAPAAGDVVYGSLDNGASWTDVTSKVSGTTLTWNGVTLAASDTLRLRVTDAAGNNGAATQQAYVLDTTGPAASVASAAFSADTGASSTDFITRTASQTVSGTLSANLASGETVAVSLDNGATWASATAIVGANTWSLAGQTLSASSSLQVKLVDTAGNDGAVMTQAYVYDTAAPVPTVDMLSTMSLTPVLTGSATLAAGETMTVTVGGATYDVTPVAGAWSLDLATAVPTSGALALVLNNLYSVTATVTDLAGNTASDSSSGELTVGTLASPPTTGATGASLSADSGASGSDMITNVAGQTISGDLSASLLAGESVQVSLDGGASWQTADASGSSWSLAGATLAAGSNQLRVKVSSADGDGPTYSRAYVLDTTAPAAPTAGAQTALTTTPTLTGSATLAAGETLSVSVGGATYQVAVSGGSWSLDLASATPVSGTLALATGSRYDVTAVVTDLAGNTSGDAGSGELLVAGVPTTVVSGMALSADSGASNNDFITNVAAQTISGSLSAPLAAGQRVEVSLDGGATWRGAAAATGSAAWSVDVTLSGSNLFMARVSSDAGNGPASQHAYTLDTTAPLATPTSAIVSPGSALSGGLSAPLATGESVLVSRDGGNSWQAASVSGSSWSSAGGADSTVQIVVRDTAGNSGSVLTVDAVVPVPPVPPVPPVQPVPVVTEPRAPADTAPGDTAPGEAAPLEAGAGNTPGAGTPDSGLPPVLSPASPSSVAIGVPAPDAPSNPLAPPNIATLTDSGALLAAFTPFGLPEQAFGGDALVVNVPIADLTIGTGERISVQLAADTFTSTSGSNTSIELSAQSADGRPLPGWLKFDGKAARFEGTPPPGFEGTLSFKVTARDANGKVAVQVFKIVVTKDGAAAPAPAPVKSSSLDRHFVDPAGRSGLNEQMRAALGTRTGAGADRLAVLSRSAAAARAAA
jgi:hypothetical protein